MSASRDGDQPSIPPDWAAIAAIRRARIRAADQPTLAEARRFGGDPRTLKALLETRREPRLARIFADDAKSLTRQKKAFAAAAAAWAEVLPREVVEGTAFLRLTRGVLWVGVPDAAARFSLDRYLRSGCLTQFLRRTPANLRDVRVVITTPPVLGAQTDPSTGERRAQGLRQESPGFAAVDELADDEQT